MIDHHPARNGAQKLRQFHARLAAFFAWADDGLSGYHHLARDPFHPPSGGRGLRQVHASAAGFGVGRGVHFCLARCRHRLRQQGREGDPEGATSVVRCWSRARRWPGKSIATTARNPARDVSRESWR